MKRRQPVPPQWFVVDERGRDQWFAVVRTLPPGTGLLVLLRGMRSGKRAQVLMKLRRVAALRQLQIVEEGPGKAARVHDLTELRRSLRGAKLLFLSPMSPTRSHPEWTPLSRMKAAAIVRLAKRPVLALGGMNAERFRRLERLGFHGWAGIDAWIRT